ncbi:RSD-2 N-terminal domain-containing protein [Caenorhabditis elegans]|uniref:RSD-2 N-terminal domain-containing protein n=1 Tax=Caenorhabditis elegans TaxID=6239 RepID=Q93845_CAEEL|nr:RSD-2 N-terminal domain-containing protein [Caenorhabditis elegans]CAB01758.1 RSD-2 N-terminal domain-containing protein [Caenorhabditis elegans]|eukprot:NP_510393.1 Uncharacterized protein CELE_K04G11.3 [Caenorhabditis elegans]
MKLRLLVLKHENNTGKTFCWNRDAHKLFCFILNHGMHPREGQFLICEESEIESKVFDNKIFSYITDLKIQDPQPSDFVTFPKNVHEKVTFKSWIGFSSVPHHLTFNRKVAYADWYGLVDSSGIEIKFAGVFGVMIAVNDLDYELTGQHLFKVVQRPWKLKSTADTSEFWQKLLQFEEKSNKQVKKPQCEISMENRQAGNNEMTSPEPTYKELSNTVKLLQQENINLKNSVQTRKDQFSQLYAQKERYESTNEIEINRLKKCVEEEIELNRQLIAENTRLATEQVSVKRNMEAARSELQRSEEKLNNAKREFSMLYEKVSQYAKDVSDKEAILPDAGQNNAEDIEIQKFINFVVHQAEELGELASNGLS